MLTYSFEDRGEESLYGHLYRCIRRDIESGAIPAYAKLPSKRAFAQHLGVSLITVEGAYTQLVAEGYVRSVPRTATSRTRSRCRRRCGGEAAVERWKAARERKRQRAREAAGACDGREGGASQGSMAGTGVAGQAARGAAAGRRRGASGQRLGAGWRTPR